jgi:hypothetical protein
MSMGKQVELELHAILTHNWAATVAPCQAVPEPRLSTSLILHDLRDVRFWRDHIHLGMD